MFFEELKLIKGYNSHKVNNFSPHVYIYIYIYMSLGNSQSM